MLTAGALKAEEAEKAKTAEEMGNERKGETKRWQKAEKANATARESEEVRGKGERVERRLVCACTVAAVEQQDTYTNAEKQRRRRRRRVETVEEVV